MTNVLQYIASTGTDRQQFSLYIDATGKPDGPDIQRRHRERPDGT